MGTQNTFLSAYSSGCSGSYPSSAFDSSSWWSSSNASDMYFRNIRGRTMCLYSAASMLPRRVSANFHSSDPDTPVSTGVPAGFVVVFAAVAINRVLS